MCAPPLLAAAVVELNWLTTASLLLLAFPWLEASLPERYLRQPPSPCLPPSDHATLCTPQAMEGRQFDDNKFNPNKPLSEIADLRLHLIKLMTSLNFTLYAG